MYCLEALFIYKFIYNLLVTTCKLILYFLVYFYHDESFLKYHLCAQQFDSSIITEGTISMIVQYDKGSVYTSLQLGYM